MKFLLKYIFSVLLLISTLASFALSNDLKEEHPGYGIQKSTVPDLVKPTIGFISPLPYAESGPEIKSAFDFLSAQTGFSSTYLTFSDLKKKPELLDQTDLLWFHKVDTLGFSEKETDRKVLKVIEEYVLQGGKLFLSMDAFKYIVTLRLETCPPQDSVKTCADYGYGRKLGFHAFRDHPVFLGLNGGAYIWRPVKDLKTRITGYFGDHIPHNGKVIAIDWDYIFLREESKLVLEYRHGKGKIIAAGAYMMYSEPNYNRAHLELFTNNIILYLTSGKGNSPEFYWDYSPTKVEEFQTGSGMTDQPFLSIPEGKPWTIIRDTLLDFSQVASDNSWDLAGERMLTMGTEKAGIEEVWAHPFMAIRDYKAVIKFRDTDIMYDLDTLRPVVVITPSCYSRVYQLKGAILKEILVNDPADPSGVVHYEYNGQQDADLIITFKSNLRLMWPYSEKVLNSIFFGWDDDYQAFVIRDKSGDFVTMIGGNRKPDEHAAGRYSMISFDPVLKSFDRKLTEQLQVLGFIKFTLKKVDILDIVYSATSEGAYTTSRYFDKAIRDPYQVYQRSESSCRTLLDQSLVITSPDFNFNKGYLWSLIATNRFMVSTPGMGKSLVAGYSTTRRGWDGGHKVNGRPGYGWYFGRDGQWSGMALLDYGDFKKVKSELEFYQKFQDLSGKILHEATTSGVIHYDAADATPLYLVLAGRYFRHTGDTAFMRQSWPYIKKAVDFCFSTDTDRDHLIENTNVGHGWVEGGKLYGSHATLYLNSCWSAALDEVAGIAQALNNPEAESYRMESADIKHIINSDFWNSGSLFYSYGKNTNGTFRSEPTILPAVPLSFRHADREKAKQVLKQYASNAFTTNWGCRIVREDSPLFNPKGYHYGSVWPLFTGWTSLAEYAYGNYQQGYSHLMDNLNIYKNWSLGMVEEVMNGSEYIPSGVCPHQCWSETMVLQPAIEGMLGLVVKAQENNIVLAPRFPADWDFAKVTNIRIGDQSFDFIYQRNDQKISYKFFPDPIRELNIEFTPALPPGTLITKAKLNGKEFSLATFRTSQNVILISKLFLNDTLDLEIEVEKGIEALPPVSDPKPGDPSAGLRLISSALKDNLYTMELEAKPGTSGFVRVYCNQEIDRVEKGKVVSEKGKISGIKVDFEPADSMYTKRTVDIYLK